MKLLLIGAFFAIFSDVYGTRSYARKTPYNITGKWYLPNINSPVFYLHFRDRISWIEADAVCQFHHSQLVTVNTPTQFEDVKSYLKMLYYEEPIWIGLRRYEGKEPFKWTNENACTIDEFWKERRPPPKGDVLCTMSSPYDDYRWTGRKCNGPDAASFICEMPVPKWVQKSACVCSLDPSITVTFHPEKSLIKAGKVCQNTDVKYIECHDPGKDEKQKETTKVIKEYLNCPDAMSAKQNFSTSPSSINATNSSTILYDYYVTLVSESGLLDAENSTGFNSSTSTTFGSKSMPTMETSSESTTVALPQEMSFAEEPIKASKPFNILAKEATEQPEQSTFNEEATSSIIKLNSKTPNYLSQLPIGKPANTNTSAHTNDEWFRTNFNISSFYSYFPTVNATPAEESHEIFNNDKNPETFQNSSHATEKPAVMTAMSEKTGTSSKDTLILSSESEEEAMSDRTYNIEGTFDSNDFFNAEPINVYKKIDLSPLESKVRETTTGTSTSYEKTTKLVPKSVTAESVASVTRPTTTITTIISSSVSADTTKTKNTPPVSTLSYNQTEMTKQTSTPTVSAIKEKQEPVGKVNETDLPVTRQPGNTFDSLLVGGRGSIDETNPPNRKRQIINTERHSFYPYFLGRILG